MKYLLSIIIFVACTATSIAQQSHTYIRAEDPGLSFTSMQVPPVKISHKTYLSKYSTRKIPKENIQKPLPEAAETEFEVSLISRKDFGKAEKRAIRFQATKLKYQTPSPTPDFLFKDNVHFNIKYQDKAHGFFSNSLTSIVQDSTGAIWVASGADGLCRLNGPEMSVYDRASGLPSNSINELYLDRNGRLWLATNRGLCYIRNDTVFTSVSDEFLLSDLNFISEGPMGRIWIGSKFNGLAILDQDSLLVLSKEHGLPGNNVNAVYHELNGSHWLALNNEGFCLMTDTSITQYSYPVKGEFNSCKSIHRNKEGLWFGFYSKPLIRYNGKEFFSYSLMPNGMHSIYSMLDNENGMWLADYRHGLIHIKDGNYRIYTEKDGLASRSVYSLFSDNNSNIWIATLNGGISRFDENLFKLNDQATGIPLVNTAGILQDRSGDTWYLPNGGFLARETEENYVHYQNKPSQAIFPLHHIFGAVFMDDGTGYFGTYSNGLFAMEKDFLKYHVLQKGNFIVDMEADGLQNVYCATLANGLMIFDGQHFFQLGVEQGLSANDLTVLELDHAGRLWAGTKSAGVNIIQGDDIACLDEENGLSSNIINCFYFDEDTKQMWIGTEAGIDIYGKDGIRRMNKQTGLHSNKIRSIAKDSDGKFWVATAYGLGLIEFKKDDQFNIRNFGKEHGLFVTDFNKSVMGFDQGRMQWGTNRGIVKFNPENIRNSQKHFVLNFNQDCLRNDNLPDGVHYNGGKLRISPGSHCLVSFAAIDWGRESMITYEYAIHQGKEDTSWIELGKKNQVLLKDIHYGNYHLLVKAYNGEVYTPVEKMDFEFLPLWYQTHFARTLFWIIILFIGPLIFYLFSRRARSIQRRLEVAVEEKTRELQAENKVKDALLQEVHHRVKNNLQSITSLIDMQLWNTQSTKEKKILLDTQLRIGAMAIVHEMLYASDDIARISVKKYLEELVATINEMTNTQKLPIRYTIDTKNLLLSVNDCIALGMLTSEVISNSIKYAFDGINEPEIRIAMQQEKEYYIYCIEDNGKGFDQNENSKESGLGMRLIDIFSRQLNADLKINTEKGTQICLHLPKEKLSIE